MTIILQVVKNKPIDINKSISWKYTKKGVKFYGAMIIMERAIESFDFNIENLILKVSWFPFSVKFKGFRVK